MSGKYLVVWNNHGEQLVWAGYSKEGTEDKRIMEYAAGAFSTVLGRNVSAEMKSNAVIYKEDECNSNEDRRRYRKLETLGQRTRRAYNMEKAIRGVDRTITKIEVRQQKDLLATIRRLISTVERLLKELALSGPDELVELKNKLFGPKKSKMQSGQHPEQRIIAV